jgi:hypothetical protein
LVLRNGCRIFFLLFDLASGFRLFFCASVGLLEVCFCKHANDWRGDKTLGPPQRMSDLLARYPAKTHSVQLVSSSPPIVRVFAKADLQKADRSAKEKAKARRKVEQEDPTSVAEDQVSCPPTTLLGPYRTKSRPPEGRPKRKRKGESPTQGQTRDERASSDMGKRDGRFATQAKPGKAYSHANDWRGG